MYNSRSPYKYMPNIFRVKLMVMISNWLHLCNDSDSPLPDKTEWKGVGTNLKLPSAGKLKKMG